MSNTEGKPTLIRIEDAVNANYPRTRNGRANILAGLGAVLLALIILTGAVFSAVTYISASSRLQDSQMRAEANDEYYAAESTASELLDMICSGGLVGSTEGTKSTYMTDSGKIVVTKAENYVAFSVPIDKKSNLKVEANINNNSVHIITWAVE